MGLKTQIKAFFKSINCAGHSDVTKGVTVTPVYRRTSFGVHSVQVADRGTSPMPGNATPLRPSAPPQADVVELPGQVIGSRNVALMPIPENGLLDTWIASRFEESRVGPLGMTSNLQHLADSTPEGGDFPEPPNDYYYSVAPSAC